MRIILRQQFRRDRVILAVWILGIVGLLAASSAGVAAEYGSTATRAQLLTVALATPALLALRGIPHGDALGSAVHFQTFAFLAVGIGLMNTFLATRHGRADEETGRRELVLAAPTPRLAPPIATLVLGMAANTVFALLAVAGYLAAGLPTSGAVLSAVTLALTGFAFLGVGLLAGEAVSTSRAANGLGLVAVLGAYALRGIGDAVGRPDIERLTLQPGWPSWFSPIGWGQQTLAFTGDRWWPILPLVALGASTTACALALHRTRELGAGLLPERRGRSAATARLRSAFALAWRLQWPTLVAWSAGTALLGLLLGSLVTAVAGADVDNPTLHAVLSSLGHADRTDVARQLIAAVLVLVAAVASAAGVQAVLRMRDEESTGRLEPVLATPRSRAGWLLSFSAVAVITVAVILLATGLASAVGFLAAGDDADAWLSLAQSVVQFPAAAVVVCFGAAAVGMAPRHAVAASWAACALVIVIGLFGGLLNLPDGLEKISPLSSIPVLPDRDATPTVLLGVIAGSLIASAAIAIRRRDVST